MIIKEAYLQEEKDKIKIFLNKFALKLDSFITKTLYVENDNNEIIGTISCQDYIIKDLAVDESYQSENIATLLVNEMINHFRINNIHNYQVFTKPQYENIFKNLGFKQLVKTEKVVLLEGGIITIDDELLKIKKILTNRFGEINETSDIGCIVINGNPITNGHMYLIEEASKNHKIVILFVVEEDKSDFTFEQRFSFAYLSVMRLGNVCVVPSTKYIVSMSTFPSYFLKDETEVSYQYSMIDALLFNEYFINYLHIKKRYVGTEINEKMITYNDNLQKVLKDKLIIIDRLKQNNEIVSASTVRKLLKENNFEEAIKYIPKEIASILKSIVSSIYGNK